MDPVDGKRCCHPEKIFVESLAKPEERSEKLVA